MKSDRPIFILGCPRSGTTMLQLMPHAHPRIAIPPETRFMVSTYQRRLQSGDLNDPDTGAAGRMGGRPAPDTLPRAGAGPRGGTGQIVDGPPTLGSRWASCCAPTRSNTASRAGATSARLRQPQPPVAAALPRRPAGARDPRRARRGLPSRAGLARERCGAVGAWAEVAAARAGARLPRAVHRTALGGPDRGARGSAAQAVRVPRRGVRTRPCANRARWPASPYPPVRPGTRVPTTR